MNTLNKCKKIKAIIVDKGLTQKIVAEKMGISAKALNDMLNGKRDFRLSHLQKLHEALGKSYTIEYLLSE